ncbi:TPA: hypothetical protein JWI70_004779 [Escherichia coli]|uniref:YncE family protein n=1 Tax=Escherichia coli TaxID=562 RepID=UPI00079FF929|nr:hypothetical protein [Escherichia coli]EFZ2275646.1 hypothetical protein [Shigella sonnei]MCZ8553180.1 hypothetical protein [Escherichia albertii]EEQ2460016.1 hypothetical protein [Escherichia coli]EEQ6526343.1 hypothetical protein [Escherichia coli]EEQ9688357.1 hypothetical protein [Escherichia coli]
MKLNKTVLAICLVSFNLHAANLVYSANQNDNTVSVVDADKYKKVGSLTLGYPAGDKRLYSPLYNGEINVHGLSYAKQRRELSVVSTVTNSVVRFDTNTGKKIDTIYVGRNPHEPRYTNNEDEIWVTVRGENYISIIDSQTGNEKKRIELESGPGMVTFSHDDKYAYISSSFDEHLWIVDTKTKKVIKKLMMPSSFSPFINTTPDGKEVWVDHKDVGEITRISTKDNEIIETFKTGKISNHFAFANNKAYVTVGGENSVNIYDYGEKHAKLIKKIQAETLPHGIWADTKGSKVYFVNELSNTLQIIDADSDKIIAKLPVGALPQALVYAENATDDVDKMIKNISQIPEFRGPKK